MTQLKLEMQSPISDTPSKGESVLPGMILKVYPQLLPPYLIN